MEWAGSILVLLIGSFLDAVDGAMARKYALDRLGEIALYSGLIAGSLIQPWIGIWALSAALMVSYVRARVGVEGVTLKGIGIAERPERLLILIVATFFWPVSHAVVTRVYRASRILSKAQ